MKKLVTILLLAAFCIQSSGRLCILIAFKINQGYITRNLCINRFEAIPVCKGSCYLEEQLNKEKQQQEKQPDLKTKEVTLYCQQLLTGCSFAGHHDTTKRTFPLLNVGLIPSPFNNGIFHPPARLV